MLNNFNESKTSILCVIQCCRIETNFPTISNFQKWTWQSMSPWITVSALHREKKHQVLEMFRACFQRALDCILQLLLQLFMFLSSPIISVSLNTSLWKSQDLGGGTSWLLESDGGGETDSQVMHLSKRIIDKEKSGGTAWQILSKQC